MAARHNEAVAVCDVKVPAIEMVHLQHWHAGVMKGQTFTAIQTPGPVFFVDKACQRTHRHTRRTATDMMDVVGLLARRHWMLALVSLSHCDRGLADGECESRNYQQHDKE